LPALPDVWPAGSINGVRALGGFEIVELKWKDAKVEKVIVKSTLGGNLRLRTHNAMKLSTGGALKKATGRNTNPFYYVEEIPTPIISDKAGVAPPELEETLVYDLPTQAGKTYTLVTQ
jgi:alpha-L-fucosidase 2